MTNSSQLPFDLAEAGRCLARKDEHIARLIAETMQFEIETDTAQSPYEALLESIAYQSISGKAAADVSRLWKPTASFR